MSWIDFVTAIGLAFCLEGMAYALFPNQFKKLFIAALEQPVANLRVMGLTAAIIGVALVWIVRG